VREGFFIADGTVKWFNDTKDYGLSTPKTCSPITHPIASSIGLAKLAATRVRGTMLWFNDEKNLGALLTDIGDRIDVTGAAFLPGEKPLGRCAGRAVEFEWLEGGVSALAFVQDLNPRRARLRRSR
jgi:cold shock CspA family protein